jgi:signal transduction histidine kinase
MHDTLIQGCVSVSALLEAHLSLGQADADAKQDLMSCARSSCAPRLTSPRSGRQPAPHSAAGCQPGTAIAEDDRRTGPGNGVPVECNISGKPFEFQQATIHELLMVVHEAIYNAVSTRLPQPRET